MEDLAIQSDKHAADSRFKHDYIHILRKFILITFFRSKSIWSENQVHDIERVPESIENVQVNYICGEFKNSKSIQIENYVYIALKIAVLRKEQIAWSMKMW